MLKAGASVLSWLAVPKDPTDDAFEDYIKKLGVPLRKVETKPDGVHIEVDKAEVYNLLQRVFVKEAYNRITVYLEKDEDDILPESKTRADF